METDDLPPWTSSDGSVLVAGVVAVLFGVLLLIVAAHAALGAAR